jgi:hypothetical protein
MVCPIMLLIADVFERNEPAALQARKFAFYRACSRADVSYDLRRVELRSGWPKMRANTRC